MLARARSIALARRAHRALQARERAHSVRNMNTASNLTALVNLARSIESELPKGHPLSGRRARIIAAAHRLATPTERPVMNTAHHLITRTQDAKGDHITCRATCTCGWTFTRTSIVTPRAGSTRRFDHPSKALRLDIQDHLARCA